MNGVRVQSIDSLLVLRAALLKFSERAETIIGECECELQGLMTWLETEADTYWRMQIRKRQEDVTKAKAALRAKKLFKTDISQRSTVDEEKALKIAQMKLEEAGKTLEAVRRYKITMKKEIDEYKGQVQRLAGSVTIDLPLAASWIESLVRHLNEYVALKASEAGEPATTGEAAWSTTGAGEDLPSMARGDIEEREAQPAEPAAQPGNAAVGDPPASAPPPPTGESHGPV